MILSNEHPVGGPILALLVSLSSATGLPMLDLSWSKCVRSPGGEQRHPRCQDSLVGRSAPSSPHLFP